MPYTPRLPLALAASVLAVACGPTDRLVELGQSGLCDPATSPDRCGAPQPGAPAGPGDPGDPCKDDRDCRAGAMCFEGSYCVGSGTLRVTLSFETDSDFDLHLLTPNGHELDYANPREEGGELDVDQCVQSCTAGEGHVENIVFAGVAPKGGYEVWVVNYDGRNRGTFRVEIETGLEVRTHTGELPAMVGASSEKFTFTLQ